MYFSHNRTSEVPELFKKETIIDYFQWLRSIIVKVKEAKEAKYMSDIRLTITVIQVKLRSQIKSTLVSSPPPPA